MQAVVLCAGRGARLGNLTETRAKAMIPIAGRPLIKHIAEQLKRVGFSDIVLVVGYRGTEIEALFRGDKRVRCVWQNAPNGTASALLSAESVLEDHFLLTYGDLWISTDSLCAMRRAWSGENTDRIGIVRVSRPLGSAVYIDQKGNALKIVEKPKWIDVADTPWNGCGLYWLSRGIIEQCRDVKPSVRGEYELVSAIQLAIDAGACIGTCELAEAPIDIGVPERYVSLCAALATRPICS